jgi:biopolymer transport protein ExbD
VWIERNGDVWINDRLIPMQDVASLVQPLWVESGQQLRISLRADAQVPYRFVDEVQEQLKRSGAVFVIFGTNLERAITREAR